MSDHHDRGAYTPQSDAPLAFDARTSRRGPGRPMPTTLIISGVILVVLVAAMAIFFVHNAHEGSTAPAGQSIDAIKSAPSVPDAKPATQAGVQIGYTEGQPLPPEAGAAATAPTTPPPAAATAGAPTFTTPPEAPGARPPPGSAPAQPAGSAKPPTIDAVLAKSQPKTEDQLIAAAQAQRPVAPKPKAAPAEIKLAEAKPEPKGGAKAAPAAVVTTGSPMVQIGAFATSAAAEQSMNAVSAKIPGRMAGKTLKIEKAQVDGKTLNRALLGGFKSKADAESFCSELKAAGGACSVRE